MKIIVDVFGRFLCSVGCHKKKYLPAPEGYMTGVFAPMTCTRECGWKHNGFPYPDIKKDSKEQLVDGNQSDQFG